MKQFCIVKHGKGKKHCFVMAQYRRLAEKARLLYCLFYILGTIQKGIREKGSNGRKLGRKEASNGRKLERKEVSNGRKLEREEVSNGRKLERKEASNGKESRKKENRWKGIPRKGKSAAKGKENGLTRDGFLFKLMDR